MRFSLAIRLFAVGFTAAVTAMIVHVPQGYAYTTRAKIKYAPTWTHAAQGPSLKMRYYGGPKSPMYP
jgi:hypothetical protein